MDGPSRWATCEHAIDVDLGPVNRYNSPDDGDEEMVSLLHTKMVPPRYYQSKIDENRREALHKRSVASVNVDGLADAIPPHESYEGAHLWDPNATWEPQEEARVVRKADLYLLSWICVMFFGLQLDRGNLSNALTDNFLKDLGMSTNDYNNGTTIQLVCFLAAEFPIQLLIKRYGFSRVLPIMMTLWGTVSWAAAFMTGRVSFYVTRALIGACEGGFIPGTILFATYFYTSRELSVRLAAFWSTLNIARVMSSLMAAGILEMRGVAGKPGWFWLFLLEGLLTTLIGVISFFYLPTSVVRTQSAIWRKPWYTEREQVIMINRLLRDDPAKGLTALEEPAKLRDIFNAWRDPSMWGMYLVGMIAYIPATPVQAYLSLTLKNLKFSTFDANMLSIPSAALQVVLMLVLAKSSEITGERTFHCLFGEFWVLPCLAALIALPAGGREWGRFTITTLISGYPYFHPIVSAWISENSFDVKKRAMTTATYNICVQIGSLIGSQIYRADDAPYYHRGNTMLLSICVVALLVLLAQRELLRMFNRRKERKWQAMTSAEQAAYQADTKARELDGNRRLEFRFKY